MSVAGQTAPIRPGATRARSGRDRRSSMLGLALVAPAFLLMVLLILVPALRSLASTLVGPDGLRLSGYAAFFADPISVQNLAYTTQVTLAAMAILFAIGLPLALYLRFSASRFVAWIQVLALFPLFVPGIVVCYALIRFLGPTGVVPLVLKSLGIAGYQTPYLHPSGAVIGLVWENIPLTVMLLTAGLSQVSNRAIEAARDVGANALQVLGHIVLPQIAPTLVVVGSLNFLGIFGAFTVPYVLGPAAPQMMSIFMQRTFAELHRPEAAEIQAAVTFLVCLVAGAIYTAMVFREGAAKGAHGR